MEIIIADAAKKETGILKYAKRVDVDIGETNDFEIAISRTNSKAHGLGYGKYIFVPGTEFGGMIEELQSTTLSDCIYWLGNTWRGFLNQIIIEPPEGMDYLTVKGDANDVIREMLQPYDLAEMFVVSEEKSGIKINTYQVPRYYTALDAISGMLAKHGARLEISAVQGGCNEAFSVMIQAVPVVDYSEELEYSDNDKNVSITIKDYRRGINHLICLGQGELQERDVIHLYLQCDKTIGKKKYFKGINERTAVYENTAAQSLADLEASGRERFLEIQSYKQQELQVSGVDLGIGDIVAGRDYDTDSYLSKPIINKILNYDGSAIKIQYKVKGED